MKGLLQIKNLTFSFGSNELFQDMSITIQSNEKIALVGSNGAGKSTLLALIIGKLEPDSGEIRKNKATIISYVEQFINAELGALTPVEAILQKIPSDEREYSRWKAESQLSSLGLSNIYFDSPIKALSGGQQNLVLIARSIIDKPDLLIMDEPSNHMDIHSLLLLEKYLIYECKFSVLLISHDQAFLDLVCNKTIFLRDKKSYEFSLNYSTAKAELIKMDIDALAKLKTEEREINRLRNTAKRLAIWGRQYDNNKFSKKSKSILKRVDKLEDTKTFTSNKSKLKLNIENSSLNAKQVLTLNNLDVISKNGTYLFYIKELIIRPGECIALLGENGCGKSTLLDMIFDCFSNTNNHSREIKFNPRTLLSYYDQQLLSFDISINLIEWILKHTKIEETLAKRSLINSGFEYKAHHKKVNTLSGGEKSRLMFIIISLNKPNLIILDEPTNHIDIDGRQELINNFERSEATTIVTSHDRFFLENIATRWLSIQDGKLNEINNPNIFYQELLNPIKPNEIINLDNYNDTSTLIKTDAEILEKIEQLEIKLENETKRSSKHIKYKAIAHLENEIDILWRKIS